MPKKVHSISSVHDRLAVFLDPLVLRQIVGAGNFFVNQVDLEASNLDSSDPYSETKYSNLGALEQYRRADGSFHFRMDYVDIDQSVEWTQTSNPLTHAPNSVSGFNLISGGDTSSFGGLSRRSSSTQLALLQGNPGETNWWFAAAATAIWPGAGANGMPATRQPQRSSGHVEIYAFRD